MAVLQPVNIKVVCMAGAQEDQCSIKKRSNKEKTNAKTFMLLNISCSLRQAQK